MSDPIQVFMTIDDREVARKIAGAVLEKRLAACVQILGPIESHYWWEGVIEEAKEWLCIMKSTKDLYGKLEETIRSIHPYEVAEILASPVAAGNPDYLNWLDREVRR